MAEPELPKGARLVATGRLTGTQREPLPGRGWLALPVDLLLLPVALLNRLAGGRLDGVSWALLRGQCRVVYGQELPKYRG